MRHVSASGAAGRRYDLDQSAVTARNLTAMTNSANTGQSVSRLSNTSTPHSQEIPHQCHQGLASSIVSGAVGVGVPALNAHDQIRSGGNAPPAPNSSFVTAELDASTESARAVAKMESALQRSAYPVARHCTAASPIRCLTRTC